MRNRREWLAFIGYQAIFWIVILLPWRFHIPDIWMDAFFPPAQEAPPPNAWLPTFAHIALFLPMGILLRRSLWWGFGTLLLAFGSEIMQVFAFRHPTLEDVGLDLLGAAIGYFSAPLLISLANIARKKSMLATAFTLSAVVISYLFPVVEADWTNWNPDYPLNIANEATLDRPWQGDLFEIRLWDHHEAKEVPLLHYDFRSPSRKLKRVIGPPLMRIDGGGVRFTHETLLQAPFESYDALLKSQKMQLSVRFRPSPVSSCNHARILSLSRTSGERNFSLIQHQDALFVRIRNARTNLDGYWPELRAYGVLKEGTLYEAKVVATKKKMTLFLNGGEHSTVYFTRLNNWIGFLLSQSPTPSLLAALYTLWGVLYCWIIGLWCTTHYK